TTMRGFVDLLTRHLPNKGKPVERRGRTATGPTLAGGRPAGSPGDKRTSRVNHTHTTRTTNRRGRGDGGFTLIELMASLTILAVGVLAAVRVMDSAFYVAGQG